MEINYILLVHRSPEQLKRLVLKLHTTWTCFYIHIDINENIKPFQIALSGIQNIFFLNNKEREKGTWGDIDIVKATIAALKKISIENKEGFCVLLSGQDYPLRSNMEIQDFLLKKKERHFITAYPLPHVKFDQGGLPRITKYKINKSGNRGHFLFLPSIFDVEFYQTETLGKLNFLRKSGKWKDIPQIFKNRRFPAYLKPYAGSQWWALSNQTIKKILSFIDDHPEYLKYHHYSLLPDEMFFQSIIMNIENSKQLEISKSLTYVNWERPSGPLPVTFKKDDFKELKEASKNYLFARKFDIEIDKEILNIIDNELLQ